MVDGTWGANRWRIGCRGRFDIHGASECVAEVWAGQACCTGGLEASCPGSVEGTGTGLWKGFLCLSPPLNDLAQLELPTKILNPTFSLSAGAARETSAPTCPGYLLGAGFKGLVEAKMSRGFPRGQGRMLLYLEAVWLPQEARMQRPDSHIPLSTQVHLGESGQRLSGTQSTGGSGPEKGSKASFLGHSVISWSP